MYCMLLQSAASLPQVQKPCSHYRPFSRAPMEAHVRVKPAKKAVSNALQSLLPLQALLTSTVVGKCPCDPRAVTSRDCNPPLPTKGRGGLHPPATRVSISREASRIPEANGCLNAKLVHDRAQRRNSVTAGRTAVCCITAKRPQAEACCHYRPLSQALMAAL